MQIIVNQLLLKIEKMLYKGAIVTIYSKDFFFQYEKENTIKWIETYSGLKHKKDFRLDFFQSSENQICLKYIITEEVLKEKSVHQEGLTLGQD